MACKCELRRKIREAAVPWVPERTVYMDYNATTPVDPRVIGAFERACRRTWGNPSSLHSAGSIRISLGRFSRRDDFFKLASTLRAAIK